MNENTAGIPQQQQNPSTNEETAQLSVQSPQKGKSKKWTFYVIITFSAIVVAGIGVGAYYVLTQEDKKEATDSNTKPTIEEEKDTNDINTSQQEQNIEDTTENDIQKIGFIRTSKNSTLWISDWNGENPYSTNIKNVSVVYNSTNRSMIFYRLQGKGTVNGIENKLYAYNTKNKKITNITENIYTEDDPDLPDSDDPGMPELGYISISPNGLSLVYHLYYISEGSCGNVSTGACADTKKWDPYRGFYSYSTKTNKTTFLSDFLDVLNWDSTSEHIYTIDPIYANPLSKEGIFKVNINTGEAVYYSSYPKNANILILEDTKQVVMNSGTEKERKITVETNGVSQEVYSYNTDAYSGFSFSSSFYLSPNGNYVVYMKSSGIALIKMNDLSQKEITLEKPSTYFDEPEYWINNTYFISTYRKSSEAPSNETDIALINSETGKFSLITQFKDATFKNISYY